MKGALGPIDELDPEHYLSLWRDVARPMPVLRSGVGLESADTRRQRHEYLDALQRVLHSVDRVTGGQVIVDSSKYATDCALLTRLPRVSVHAIHLVRDSRAVAYSWQRKKARPEIHWQAARHVALLAVAELLRLVVDERRDGSGPPQG